LDQKKVAALVADYGAGSPDGLSVMQIRCHLEPGEKQCPEHARSIRAALSHLGGPRKSATYEAVPGFAADHACPQHQQSG
jgi:hypothetical protein